MQCLWYAILVHSRSTLILVCRIGAGEYITRSALARSIGEALEMAGEDGDIHEILRRVLLDCFWSRSFQIQSSPATDIFEAPSRRRQGDANPNAGVLLLTRERYDGGLSIRTYSIFGCVDEFLNCPHSAALVCFYDGKYGNWVCIFEGHETKGSSSTNYI